jgi:hypothetical protein
MSIEAMKQALDLLEVCNGAEIVEGVIIYTDKEITALRQAIEQAEKQKPFAYLDPGLGAFYWAREYPDGPPPGFEPVYLAGSNKRWVGLTQEDIDIAFDDTQEGGGFNEFARAIEQTLRRKNT